MRCVVAVAERVVECAAQWGRAPRYDKVGVTGSYDFVTALRSSCDAVVITSVAGGAMMLLHGTPRAAVPGAEREAMDDLAMWWDWWYFADVDDQGRADLCEAVAWFLLVRS